MPQAAARPEVKQFRDWLEAQAAVTRQVIGEVSKEPATLGEEG